MNDIIFKEESNKYKQQKLTKHYLADFFSSWLFALCSLPFALSELTSDHEAQVLIPFSYKITNKT